MSTAESFYIIALREPGSREKPKGYVICKAIASIERDATATDPGGSQSNPAQQQTIATFLDEQFAPGASQRFYEAISWKEGVPIPDGTESDALSLGTADED